MGSYLDKPIVNKESFAIEANGLKFGASAMQGWRVEMEDSHTVVADLDSGELEGHAFIAVYDGHGGDFSAKYCGLHMVKFLQGTKEYQEYKQTKDVNLLIAAITSAYLELDRVLKGEDEMEKKGDTSGCTAVCAIITPKSIVVGNSGDSRAIVANSTTAIALSRDHKPYLEDEKRRIEEAGGMVSMQRVDGDLALSRSIGDFQYKDRNLPPERQKVTAYPEVRIHTRTDDDELLVLACDGVWDVCDNDEVAKIIRDIISEGETDMKKVCEELLDQCLIRYSKDNISAVVVTFPPMWTRHYREGAGVDGRRRRRDDQAGREGGGGGGGRGDDDK